MSQGGEANNGLFNNKYRIKSARLSGYDYSRNGFYFITMCTKRRQYFFGKIIDRRMILNQLGKITDKYWKEIPKHFPFVKLDEYIIMPNHVHGIVVIDRGDGHNNRDACVRRDAINRVSTNVAKWIGGGITGKHNPMGKNTLGEIIRWYKGRCKFEINHRNAINRVSTNYFGWQPKFYDHIIRNDRALNKIRQYILNNSAKWEFDRNNQDKI